MIFIGNCEIIILFCWNLKPILKGVEMDTYESVLLVKPEVFVFNIPPRSSNRGYRFVFLLSFHYQVAASVFKHIHIKYSLNLWWLFSTEIYLIWVVHNRNKNCKSFENTFLLTMIFKVLDLVFIESLLFLIIFQS